MQNILAELQNAHPLADPTDLSVLVSGCMALLSPEANSMSLPDCPVSNLHSAARLLVSVYFLLFLFNLSVYQSPNNLHLILEVATSSSSVPPFQLRAKRIKAQVT